MRLPGCPIAVYVSAAINAILGMSQMLDGASPTVTIPKIKRQSILSARREAVVEYYCPLSGQQERTFIWSASYDRVEGDLEMISVQNIDSWHHVDWIANDFATTWLHRSSTGYEHHCCAYTFEGRVIGAIMGRAIEMTLARARRGVTVAEECVQIVADDMCPAKTMLLTATFSRCEVTDVSVYHT